MAHHDFRVSGSAFVFTSHVRALHEKIRDKINVDYKGFVDLHRRLRTFNVGDYVMVRLKPEQFPPGTVKKVHTRSVGVFQILKRINSNTYVVDLPSDFDISCTFNVENLISYKGTFDIPSDPFMGEPTHDLLLESPPLPPLTPKFSYAIENIDST